MKKTLDDVLGKERKLHWRFIGFKKLQKMPDGQYKMDWISEITVNHYQKENDALEAAKKILKRPHYHLKDVWECTQCQTTEEQMELYKKLKKHIE